MEEDPLDDLMTGGLDPVSPVEVESSGFNTKKAKLPQSLFRRLVKASRPYFSSNLLLTAIARTADFLSSRQACPYYTSSLDVTVTTTQFPVRDANKDAFRTIVTNNGLATIKVYDTDVLVCIVPGMSTKSLPLGGTGVISLKTVSGTADAVVTTFVYTYCL